MADKLIRYRTFPNYLASDEEKATNAYGLAMGKAIEYEWFYRPDDGTSMFYDKILKYDKLRRYARGEQDTAIYKQLLNNGEDTSYTNYDWRPIQIVPKFVKLIVNQMSERLYEVKAEATDKYSTDLKNNYRDYLEDLRVSKELIAGAKEAFGVDLMPVNMEEIPDTQEEIDLYMSLKYKPAIEIATEEAIKYTFGLNNFEETQSRIIEDIATIGIGAVKHGTDVNKGITLKYIDPADIVYAYPKDRDFENVHYYGEVERMTVTDLKRISGDRFSNDQLLEMAKGSSTWGTYHGRTNQFPNINRDNFEGVMVDVLHFTYKALNTITYKKKYNRNGGFKMTRKESTFSKKSSDYEGYDVVKKNIEVWYEGSLVLGTDHLFNYKLCENMVRPNGLLNITVPNYVLYAPELYQNRSRSLVESIVPLVDEMQQIHMKIQQLIAKSRPNGIYIDVNGLEEIALGDGNFLTPLELIKIYDETGNVLGTSVNSEGEYNYGRQPITELKNGGITGLGDMITAYNHYLNQVRDTLGIPAGADATMPHPDTAVGVQEQVALNSNTATRHILNGALNITRRTAKGLVLRLRDIFKYSDLKEVYINAIGKINVDILNSMKNFHLHDMGVLIMLKPDLQDKQLLEQNITAALSKEQITLDDAIDVRDIGNLKLANRLLKARRAKREKEVRQFEMEKIQATIEGQQQSAQITAQAKMQELQAKAETEIAVENTKTENKIKELQAEAALKSELMEKEFQFNMQLKGIEVQGKQQVQDRQQQGKIALQDRGNTQASKLIEQRTYNAPSQNFESTEDTLGGSMDMGEMGVS